MATWLWPTVPSTAVCQPSPSVRGCVPYRVMVRTVKSRVPRSLGSRSRFHVIILHSSGAHSACARRPLPPGASSQRQSVPGTWERVHAPPRRALLTHRVAPSCGQKRSSSIQAPPSSMRRMCERLPAASSSELDLIQYRLLLYYTSVDCTPTATEGRLRVRLATV